jgi:hypothetical protein
MSNRHTSPCNGLSGIRSSSSSSTHCGSSAGTSHDNSMSLAEPLCMVWDSTTRA